MLKLSSRLFCLLLMMITGPLLAQSTAALEDFAWKSTLSASESRLQRLELPVRVLQDLTQSNMADLSVIDASGQKLPSLVRKVGRETRRQQVELEFHRFRQPAQTDQLGRISIGGGYVDENQGNYQNYRYQQTVPLQHNRVDYIIELSDQQLTLGIDEIRLWWQHEPSDMLLTLKVQTSRDLVRWTTLHDSRNLYPRHADNPDWVNIGGFKPDTRYIRLSSTDSLESFDLTRVVGFYRSSQSASMKWADPGSELQPEKEDAAFLYFEYPHNIRSTALRLLMADGFFISGDLYASNDSFERKRLIRRHVSSHQVDDLDAANEISLADSAYRHWWFKPVTPLISPVRSQWGYPAYEILFASSQHLPLTLVWGNASQQHYLDSLTAMMNGSSLNSQQFEDIHMSEFAVAGGQDRLQLADSFNWLTGLLWLALLLALAIIARMAWVLYREMNSQ